MDLLLLSAVSHQVFHHLPVHQRLTAEKVHLQISSVAGIGNQEIQRLLAYLKTHQRSAAMVLAFLRKAVFTGQITVMGNVQTERLDNGLDAS